MLNRLVAAAVTTAALLAPNIASADVPPTVLDPPGQTGIACAQNADGTRFCQGSTFSATPGAATAPVASFDGTTLDVNVSLPRAGRPDGGYPLIIVGHGWGGAKQPFDGHEAPWFPSAHELALRGYAVLNVTDRGWGGSCGAPQARLQNPQGCLEGWNHLLDARYEVRDVQYLAGELADEGLVDPQRIGAIGESYGGGLSLMLATLKDRVVNTDGTIAPWRSPQRGLSMRIAAATPTIPWTDLINSLLPNGRTLDNTITGPTDDYTPAGVLKQSFVAGLFATGTAPPGPLGSGGYYAPPGADESADLTQWFALTNAGEPYESNPQFASVIDQLKNFRSAYYMLQGSASPVAGQPREAPAPLLLSNGFTDDLFPVDETLRYYNLERALFPSDPIALTYMDYGHMRGQNKPADLKLLLGQVNAWIDHYVKGGTPDPGQPVTALTQTCPSSAPSGGPYAADSWVDLHPGVLRYATSAAQTISSSGGDPSVAIAFDPIAGAGACATAPATDENGTATYSLPTATGNGFTMIGAPEVVAKLNISGVFPEIAERLLDVGPDGNETLVARGVYRPADTSTPVIFQLHPGAWHFAAGHHPKLELLGRDAPYVRASNGTFTIDVASLTLLLPTRETSGNGIVAANGAPIPAGARPAPRATCRAARRAAPKRRRTHRRSRRAAPKRRRTHARSRRAATSARRHAARRKRRKRTSGVHACPRSPAHRTRHRTRKPARR